MFRFLARSLMALGVTAIGCSTPTEVCGCPPARSAVFVTGTLTDAAGTPVAGARLFFDGVPQAAMHGVPQVAIASGPPFIGGSGDVQSDPTGGFRTRVYSFYAPTIQTLRVAVVRAGTADTIRLNGGLAAFRYEGERPDTVRLALRLP